MYAVRNIRLCTKDCLCLYVCPTGATDTEDGQIDPTKCIDGCRACVDACTSHAISLIPKAYPAQQVKEDSVVNGLKKLAEDKIKQGQIAKAMGEASEDPVVGQLMASITMSDQLMAEDLLREAGYMLPQSKNTQKLLEELMEKESEPDFPREAVVALLELLKKNDEE